MAIQTDSLWFDRWIKGDLMSGGQSRDLSQFGRPFSVNKRSEVCQPQPSLLVFVLAIEAYDLVLCLALT